MTERQYGGDHSDFGGGTFHGPVIGRADLRVAGPAPTAVDSLPAKATGFTGREAELRKLLKALDPSVEGEQTVLVAAVSGLGGIGKTALAVEAAHEARARGWFPGGALFIDLHGYDDNAVSGASAVQLLLHDLGVPPQDIPVEWRDAFYRAALKKRAQEAGAVLIVADNASKAEQVRPLLLGGDGHRVLVTSRDRLPSLGARRLALDELTPKEAYDLLDRVLRMADPEDGRIAEDAEVAERLAGLCGHLPLALQIVGALLADDPDKPVAELVGELAGSRSRLDRFYDGERSVRATFELSYQRLPEEQARVLRLLALAPGPESGAAAIAALLGADEAPLTLLGALERAHPVERGSGRERWRLHDLVREYAAGLATVEEGEAARKRVLDFYDRWADAADRRLRWLPGMPEVELFADRAGALAWLDAERANLVTAAQWAGHDRHAATAIGLALNLAEYLAWRRAFDD